MIAHGFPSALIERCSRAAADDDPRILAVSHSWTDVVMGMMTPDELRETIIAVLRESGHAELVAALKTVAGQHALFVGPDDDIANATKEVVRAALVKAGAQ